MVEFEIINLFQRETTKDTPSNCDHGHKWYLWDIGNVPRTKSGKRLQMVCYGRPEINEPLEKLCLYLNNNNEDLEQPVQFQFTEQNGLQHKTTQLAKHMAKNPIMSLDPVPLVTKNGETTSWLVQGFCLKNMTQIFEEKTVMSQATFGKNFYHLAQI
mmetsp:Transcript_62475/g.69881  ORF Transcript_62475/g.69881 Transcript_62475/m.69881 type:complete len:157 (+) Transcript_62475:143-613(+)